MEQEELTKRERKKLNREKSEEETKPSVTSKLPVVGAIVALALGAFLLMYKGGNPAPQPQETPAVLSAVEISPEDHTKGPENALVTLVEYGDFQCPACASYQPVVDQLAEEFKDDLRVVYRHFPLRSIHKHAQISAQAAEAAADQGYFWEMYKLLYERQDDWINTRDPRSLFKEYAEELTLNLDQFEEYMNSQDAKAKVDADYNSGNAAGLNSTPTFFVNGEKIVNPKSIDEFREVIRNTYAQLAPEGRGEESSGESTPQQ